VEHDDDHEHHFVIDGNKKMDGYLDDTDEYGRTDEIMEQENQRNEDVFIDFVSNEDPDEDPDGIMHEDLLDYNEQFSNDIEESDPLIEEFVSDSSNLTNSHYNQVNVMIHPFVSLMIWLTSIMHLY